MCTFSFIFSIQFEIRYVLENITITKRIPSLYFSTPEKWQMGVLLVNVVEIWFGCRCIAASKTIN